MSESFSNCAFCDVLSNGPHRLILQDDQGFFLLDAYPVSQGHGLVVSNRHVSSFFELTKLERKSLLGLLESAKRWLDRQYAPDAYNIGINDGAIAGQTIPHVHIHLIPRYEGDVFDPRGGVRWTIPEKANYWD
ncbi:HIT family protein [Congregibacter litoralis]|uniref:Diadenosine tetraphosphate (Ap4A) hydrolase and other HIT family hydrolase n=1 Tax=Congregibacter litoralis KT71 TaxID=314285 RepID=A4AB32_9GAMM|nr:HIT family protein [Congregibacter litoralis]EAQ96904.2 Diadenosine tetraphosphate (Ap4A) hydrolase and other HIT family hydrolase [Congregibacter litoralis KT71]